MTIWFIVTPFASHPAGDFSVAANIVLLTVHLLIVSLAYGIDRYRIDRGLPSQGVSNSSCASAG
jgi:hypothetical protein